MLSETMTRQWHNLSIGKSHLVDVESALGSPGEVEELADGAIYYFCRGAVSATFLKDRAELFRIRICSNYIGPDSVPCNLSEARQKYPGLSLAEAGDMVTIYRAKGVTLCCQPLGEQVVLWVEFSP